MRTQNIQTGASTMCETLFDENRRLRAEADGLRARIKALGEVCAALALKLEQSLAHKRFRYDALSFMLAHQDVDETVAFIAEHLLALSGCDRIAATSMDGRCRTWSRQGASYPDCACFSRCPTCPLAPEGRDTPDLLVVPDVRQPPDAAFPEECLAKSVVSLLVRADDTPWCRLTLHYIEHPHTADEYELRSIKLGADVIATALERRRLVAAQEAETALRVRALDKAPISAYIKDADDDFRYVFINDFTLAQLGLKRVDVIGRTDFDIIPRVTAAAYRRNDEAAAASDESLSRQETYRDYAGRLRHVQSFRCSARDANGHRLVIGYSLDLTELLVKQARIEALQKAAETERDRAIAAEKTDNFIAQLIKHVANLPPETDPMDSVLARVGPYAGAARCSVFYYRQPETDALADNVYEWCAPGVAPARAERQGCDFARLPDFQREIAAGRDVVFQDLRTADPSTRALLARHSVRSLVAAPILDEPGAVVGFACFSFCGKEGDSLPKTVIQGLHEATDVISVCRTRRLAFAAVRAAERAKSDFFASVSHDIRTPLNAIIGFSELLQNETDAALRREYLDNIAFSGNTLLELVNDVLDLAKLDAGQMVFSREPFDLRRQIQLILRTFESAAREKRLALGADFGDLPVVELDEQRTRQILFNLVGNAIKYTDEGSVTVSASFERTAPDRGALRLAVRDTGIGIAPEDVARLMTPYVRLRAANARGGTGLGLSICKRIVEGMGGTLSLSSELGKGSVFTVLFPDVRCRDAAPAAPTAQAAPPVDSADVAALRVLVVDDLEMNRRVLEASCRRLGTGYAASAASSEEALERLRREPFDLVLTDMKMPGMDGGAFLRAVRADPALAGLIVFLVTADVEARKYYRDLGADGVLLKPVVHARIAETLSAVRLMRGCRENSAAAPSAANS